MRQAGEDALFKELLAFFGVGAEAGPASGHRGLAFLLVISGVGLVLPGPKEALVAVANKWASLQLPLDAPWYAGLFLIVAGMGVYVYGEQGLRRERSIAATAPPGTFVALHHQSFDPPTALLPAEAVPARLGRRTIRHIEIDQSQFLSGGTTDPAGAVRQQHRMISDLAAIRRTDPEAAIGYYGIVHVPLQFLAGCAVSTWHQVALFDLSRDNQQWRELRQGSGPDLGLAVTTVSRPENPVTAVIRIAISYPVPTADAAEIVGGPFEDISMAITPPRIDAVTHYGQIDTVCSAFRHILDDLQTRLERDSVVHVFYAGPVGLGFSLGRTISRTIHHGVQVHNYNARVTPRYAWGVEVNGDPGTVPRIVQATQFSASPAGNP